MMARLQRDWQALDGEQRLAGGAAVALFVTMLLPWYQQNAVVNMPRTAPLQSRNLSAFGVFSFVEAAVLLVALAVVYLLYARAEGRKFHLPGSDGAVVMVAGLWTALLLVFRLFDKPGITSNRIAANVGVQWGIFFALAAASLMAYAGSRMRAMRRPEPPVQRSAPEAGAPEASEARERPRHPPAPPMSSYARADASSSSPTPRQVAQPGPVTPSARRGARRAPVPATPATEQLSFEDPPTEPEQRSA